MPQAQDSKYPRLGVRGKVAYHIGKLAIRGSRILGKGSGGNIGGLVADKIDPALLAKLCKNKQVILVTGTNGKSTTSKMLRKAIETLGPVTANIRGDNIHRGILSTFITDTKKDLAVLEVDELHLGKIAKATNPCGFVLLNLSRDQLDRVGEITRVEAHIRNTVLQYPNAFVVANCDDPLVSAAAWQSKNVIWVAAGCNWRVDSVAFPLSGTPVIWDGDNWIVRDRPEFTRPKPQYWISDGQLCTSVKSYPIRLQVPGAINLGNAAQAVAASVAMGVDISDAIAKVSSVSSVAGRYARVNINNRLTRILLAKNPAGWQEALSMMSLDSAAIIISVNGQIADGKDLSWLWDVNFESLKKFKDKPIIACGDRGADLAVRLGYAGIECKLLPTAWEAIQYCPPGELDALLNYTAFHQLTVKIKVNEESE